MESIEEKPWFFEEPRRVEEPWRFLFSSTRKTFKDLVDEKSLEYLKWSDPGAFPRVLDPFGIARLTAVA